MHSWKTDQEILEVTSKDSFWEGAFKSEQYKNKRENRLLYIKVEFLTSLFGEYPYSNSHYAAQHISIN